MNLTKVCICCRERKKAEAFEGGGRVCKECHSSGKYEAMVEERNKQYKATKRKEAKDKRRDGTYVLYPFECQLCEKVVDVEATHTLNLGSKTFIVCNHCARTVIKLPYKYREIHTRRGEESWFRNEDT